MPTDLRSDDKQLVALVDRLDDKELICFSCYALVASLFRSHVKNGGLEAEAWRRSAGLEVLIRQSTGLG